MFLTTLAAWMANPPWAHPIVPWWNCIVVAKPLIWCKNDWSDWNVASDLIPTTSVWGLTLQIEIVILKINDQKNIGDLAWDYFKYQKSWWNVDKKSFNDKLNELVYSKK